MRKRSMAVFIVAGIAMASFQNCAPNSGFSLKNFSEPSSSDGQNTGPLPIPTKTQVLKLSNPNLSVQPGQSVTLTTQFNALPMDKDYVVFIHFVDSSGVQAPLNGDYTPTMSTTQWSGLIQYNQTVNVPSSLPVGQYSIRIGLYENVAPYLNRASLELGPGVSADSENRYLVGTLSVSNSAPSPSPVPNPIPTPTPTPTPSGTPAVKFYGRFDTSDSAGPKYTWSGSSMVARFTGTSLSVTLNESPESGSNNIFYAYVIDNQAAKRLETTAGVRSYTLASNLPAGEHQVLLMRDSEGNIGVSQFRGFSFGGGGQLLAPPSFSSKYRLEVIGDSMSAGYGDLGVPPCPFSSETESAYYAYPQQTALLLGAEPARNISYSGIGIYRNWGQQGPDGGFPAMPSFYPRTLTDAGGTQGSFSGNPQEQPTIVVINLGSNDFWDDSGPSQSDFLTAYKSFVKTVRGKYPNAYIISALRNGSGATSFVQTAVNQLASGGENRIKFVELPLIGSPMGCNGHGSKETQYDGAVTLANAIKALGL